jgi:hypothetical protein
MTTISTGNGNTNSRHLSPDAPEVASSGNTRHSSPQTPDAPEVVTNGNSGDSAGSTANSTNGSKKNSDSPATPTHDELRDRYLCRDEDCSYGLGEWRRYGEGIYTSAPELTIRQGICEVIEAAKPQGIKPTSALLSSVTELTRVKVSVPDDKWDADPDILVCKNKTLRISTRDLGSHSKDHYATSAVPYDYNPRATPLDVCCVVWRCRKGPSGPFPTKGAPDGPKPPYPTPRPHGRGRDRSVLPDRRRLP